MTTDKIFAERLINKMCTNELNRSSLEALLVCRLVPSNNKPGIRPIGVRHRLNTNTWHHDECVEHQ